MQTMTGTIPELSETPDRPASASSPLEEYEARRCAICGARYPCFGFGPPLTRTGGDLWACGAHRAELDQRLSGTFQRVDDPRQASLL
jgi:hypothetical protein